MSVNQLGEATAPTTSCPLLEHCHVIPHGPAQGPKPRPVPDPLTVLQLCMVHPNKSVVTYFHWWNVAKYIY